MLRLASDENVHGGIVRGLRRRAPELDIVRVMDVGLAHTPDPDILEWAAAEGRLLITVDVSTMVGHAIERVRAGRPMPGVLVLRDGAGMRAAIDDLLLVAECYSEEEIKGRVEYLPI